jgi:hypothetical protein
MKKLLLLTTLALSVAVTQAQQGTVGFINSSATPLRANGTNVTATVALYGAAATGLSSDSTLTQLGATVNTFTPGLFSGGTRNVGNPGDTVTLQVRAWTGGFATWDLAQAAALANPNVFVTVVRPMWEQPVGGTLPGGGGSLPTQPITGAGRFAGATLTPVPEPSSIALGLLGLGAIVLFRRRK